MYKGVVVLAFLICTGYHRCLAANEGNCKIHFPNNETINWDAGYDNRQTLKDTDDVELILPFENKLEVRSVTNPNPHIAEYFSVNTLGTNLVIKTTDKFKDFEKDYGCYTNAKWDTVRFIITVTMTCESEKPSSLDLQFRFSDTNNHDPTFPKASYEYKVASPLVPDLDYTLLGQEIIAEDVDFSNTDITFTIENNDYFSLSSKKVENCFPRKQAVIKAKTFTYLKSETTELILTATDSGTPPRKSTTKLIFIRNKDAVLPEVPKFQKPLYSATYSVNGNDHSLKLDELITATPKEAVVSLSKTSNDAALLKNFTPIKSGNSWDLKLNAHLDDAILKRGDTLSIILEATIDNDDKGIGYTTITIKLPHVEAVETPKFAKSFYYAQYSDSLSTVTVSLTDGPINVIFPSPNQLEFSQDESNPQYFKFDYTANPQITVATKLPNDILRAGKDVFIKINVKSKGSSAIASSTVIAVHLPPVKTLKFDKDVYTFDYKTDQSTHYLKGPSNLKLLVKDTQTKIDFVQTQATTSNFVIDQTTYEISVKTNLDKTVLDNDIELVLSVKATSDLSLDGFATIIINLPRKATVIPTPKFAKSFYNTQYSDNLPTPTVSLTDGPINVTFSAQDQLEFSQDDSNPQYFKFDYTANPQISVATKLPNGILKANKDVFIKLNVKSKGSSAIASSTVIAVHLPPVKTLKFDKDVYTFDYKTDQSTHYLTGTSDLKLLVKDTQTTIDFVKPTNNFVIDQTTYKISVKTNLDKPTLDNDELVLSVRATSDLSLDGFATVIINLPKKVVIKPPPTFKQSVYYMKYILGGKGNKDRTDSLENVQISLGDQVDLASALVTFTTDSANKPHFDVNRDQKVVTIKLLSNLGNEALKIGDDISINLKVNDHNGEGTTIVIVKLPKTSPPKFTKALYSAQYDVIKGGKDTVKFDNGDAIELKGGFDHYDFTGTPFHDNFQLTCSDDNKCVFDVKSNLDLNNVALAGLTELIFELNASLDIAEGSSTASLKLTLPPKSSEVLPKFSRTIYRAQYSKNDGNPDKVEAQPIEIVSGRADQTEVHVDSISAYSSNFAVKRKDNHSWDFTLSNPISSDILQNTTQIFITLTALIPGNANIGSAVVAVDLIKKPSDLQNPPVFKSAHFTGHYIVTDGKASVQMNEPIQIRDEDDGRTTVSIRGTYQSNFHLQQNKPKKQWDVVVDHPLENATIHEQNHILVDLNGHAALSSGDSQATLLLTLRDSSDPALFGSLYYRANYVVENNEAKVAIVGKIDLKNAEAAVEVTGEYKNNFHTVKNGNLITINVNQKLSQDVLDKNRDLSIDLTATLEKVQERSVIILDLPLKNNNNSTPQTLLEFKEPVYTFLYSITDGIKAENGPIAINGVANTSLADVSLQGDDAKYFALETSKASWDLKLSGVVLPENLLNEISVTLTIAAELKDRSKQGKCVLVVKLPKRVINTPVYFSRYFYTASYVKNGNKFELHLNNSIELEGALKNVTIDSVAVEGEYKQYFVANHDNFKLSVALRPDQKIPDDIIKKNPSIIVTLQVTFSDKTEITSNFADKTTVITAPLIVQLTAANGGSNGGNGNEGNYNGNGDGNNNGGLVAAVAVLAVLLLIVLVGCAVFYYMRYRRRSKDSALIEEDEEVSDYPKYTKNSTPESKSKYDSYAQRRPTGLTLSYPVSENKETESTTDFEEPMERRKSVQFNTKIEELEVEPSEVVEESEYVEVVDGEDSADVNHNNKHNGITKADLLL